MSVLLSTLDYASYLSYTPRPREAKPEEILSKRIRYLIKGDAIVSFKDTQNVPMSEFIAKSLKEELGSLPFSNLFGKDISLVPVPKSSLMVPGTLWVPQRIVNALCKLELGKELNCLIRKEVVLTSHLTRPEDRPKAIDHYRTIDVQTNIGEAPKSILLVDDFITKGATLLGAASRLNEAFPNIPISAFVIMRTISNPVDFEKINSPVVDGKITLNPDGSTHRDP